MEPEAMSPASEHSSEMWGCRLGTIPYLEGVEIQERVAARRRAKEIPDTLLLLEHPPVYTRGRRATDTELSLGEGFYRAQGIEIVPTDRGGRVTYHGPGQLVGYPIMGVSDVLAHLRSIEAAIVQALAEEGIAARSRCEEGPDWTGVWVGQRKIASLGVHVSRGVSTHGFAINVVNDLTPFTWIVPCGLAGVSMTSVAAEIGLGAADLERFADRVVASLCRVHGREPQEVAPAALGIETVAA
jgi:lipoyl(octanoyl) transferase